MVIFTMCQVLQYLLHVLLYLLAHLLLITNPYKGIVIISFTDVRINTNKIQ